MNRLTATVGAAAGGMLASAFLSTAVAVADTAGDTTTASDTTGSTDTTPSLITDNFTFTPVGDTDIPPDFTIAPFVETGTGSLTFTLADSSGTLGTFTDDDATVSNIFGITTTQFDFDVTDFSAVTAPEIQAALVAGGVTDSDFIGGGVQEAAQALARTNLDFASGDLTDFDIVNALGNDSGIFLANFNVPVADALNAADLSSTVGNADLPVDQTFYSVTNFGLGFENFYEAVPAATEGSSPDVTDVLLTPFGNFNITSFIEVLGFDPFSIDATAALDSGVDVAGAGSGLGDMGADGGGLGDGMGDALGGLF
jgi:hypothetical protein